jgi:hypothetical protein
LTGEVLKRLKLFVKPTDQLTITLKHGFPPEETKEEYSARLAKSIDDVENNRNLVSFTLEEFKAFSQSLHKG